MSKAVDKIIQDAKSESAEAIQHNQDFIDSGHLGICVGPAGLVFATQEDGERKVFVSPQSN